MKSQGFLQCLRIGPLFTQPPATFEQFLFISFCFACPAPNSTSWAACSQVGESQRSGGLLPAAAQQARTVETKSRSARNTLLNGPALRPLPMPRLSVTHAGNRDNVPILLRDTLHQVNEHGEQMIPRFNSHSRASDEANHDIEARSRRPDID
jgi:hypothetical protein